MIPMMRPLKRYLRRDIWRVRSLNVRVVSFDLRRTVFRTASNSLVRSTVTGIVHDMRSLYPCVGRVVPLVACALVLVCCGGTTHRENHIGGGGSPALPSVDANDAGAEAGGAAGAASECIRTPGAVQQCSYEGPPVTGPVLTLPAVFEFELCNFRDSVVASIGVVPSQPVTISLENPESIESFDLSIVRADVAYQEIMPIAGSARVKVGRRAAHQTSFTPAGTEPIAIYAGLGASCEPVRLRIEQD